MKPLENQYLAPFIRVETSDSGMSCAGDLHKLEDGEEYTFERARVTVKRNGEELTFTKQ